MNLKEFMTKNDCIRLSSGSIWMCYDENTGHYIIYECKYGAINTQIKYECGDLKLALNKFDKLLKEGEI